MSVYRRSVRNCVIFPCVVYFCLFSPLKDRYVFSICLQLLGLRPQTPTGALPLDPAGDLRPANPLFCRPPLATPLCINEDRQTDVPQIPLLSPLSYALSMNEDKLHVS